MKCEICSSEISGSCIDDELICQKCGASYRLELLGYYKEGSNNRIECGEEFDKWKLSFS